MDKRLAIYLPHLEGGGVQKVVRRLIGEFLGRGLAVDLLLNHRRGQWLEDLPPTVRVLELRAVLGHVRIASLVGYLRTAKPAALLALLEGPNLLSSWVKGLGLAGGTRVVVSVRNVDDRLVECYPFGLKKLLFKMLYPWSLRWADGVIAVSQGVKDGYLIRDGSLPEEKVTTILNPADVREVTAAMEEPITEDWFDRDFGPFLMGAGRLEPQKDFGNLIRAFSMVRREWPGRLLLVGEGSERKRLEALVGELGLGEVVRMPGHVRNPWKFMRRSEAFVLSSKHEGFGNVLVEAMACGTRVVSTDCPWGPSEVLEGGRWGRLVPVGDTPALARALSEALRGPHPVDHSGRLAGLSLGKCADRYLEVLGLGDAPPGVGR